MATDQARRWLASQDHAELVGTLHTNLRFIGELMYEISGTGLTVSEINDVANKYYYLGWQSLDPVQRRCYWLRAAGMAELLFTGKVILTTQGREVLTHLKLVCPRDFESQSAVLLEDLPQLMPEISKILKDLDQGLLESRVTAGLNHVPKGAKHSLISSLAAQVNAATPRIERDAFIDFCASEFRAKPSSAISALDAVRNAGLFIQVDRAAFEPSEAALAWRASGLSLDLVGIVHANIRCVGELLPLLDETRTVGELSVAIESTFPGLSFGIGALRNRLHLLREAGLVEQPTNTSFRVTPLGRTFAKTLPLETAPNVEQESPDVIAAAPEDPTLATLFDSASDAAHSERLEKAVTAVFQELGLDVTHIGGQGQTDILITIRQSPTESIRIIVDTKASKYQSILENAVDFGTLEEHRVKYSATHVALVAPGFDTGRVRSRAAKTGCALITVQELADILSRSRSEPLAPVDLIPLFSAESEGDLWGEADRRAEVLSAVITAVADESEYVAETGRSFDQYDIHRALRRAIQPSPSMDEVTAALDLLASPLVGGVCKGTKDGYLPGLPVESVGARLSALAFAVQRCWRTLN
ncbi:restriction endonuclease [Nocardia sp. NPDC047038]|uniref:restriction endonuclease n=1 Tax=Nocardia sp. NPDC047038 TaxID=3154338 RepID=UPI0033F96B55